MNMIRAKKTLTVGAREANQRFSHFLRQVELGNEVVITRNGKQVAKLIGSGDDIDDKARQKAIAKMVAMMKKGLGMSKLGRRLTREEMNER
ncbi:MAG: type II toxin-antitoxin system Phd/YefM family antitoxin [Micropepsaceae bacterium]